MFNRNRDREDNQQVELVDGEYVRRKFCARCGKLIATYPSPDMTVQKFNPMKFCTGCKKIVKERNVRDWKRADRAYRHETHREVKKQLALLREETQKHAEQNVLLKQENAKLQQRIRELGGVPDTRPDTTAERQRMYDGFKAEGRRDKRGGIFGWKKGGG